VYRRPIIRVIADVMGWEEDYVEKIIRRCVGRHAATRATIAQLNRASRDEA
jgi:rRNA processing protein Krr1/Pno1